MMQATHLGWGKTSVGRYLNLSTIPLVALKRGLELRFLADLRERAAGTMNSSYRDV